MKRVIKMDQNKESHYIQGFVSSGRPGAERSIFHRYYFKEYITGGCILEEELETIKAYLSDYGNISEIYESTVNGYRHPLCENIRNSDCTLIFSHKESHDRTLSLPIVVAQKLCRKMNKPFLWVDVNIIDLESIVDFIQELSIRLNRPVMIHVTGEHERDFTNIYYIVSENLLSLLDALEDRSRSTHSINY
jgi:hypothetical protein